LLADPLLERYISNIDQRPNKAFVYNMNGTCLSLDSDEGGLVLRRVFDNELFQRAKKAPSATIWEGYRLRDFEYINDGIRITAEGDGKTQIATGKIIVGAEGINSLIAHKTGLKKKWEDNDVILVYMNESEIGKEKLDAYYGNQRNMYFHFGFKNTYGYGWIFVKHNHVNVGFGGKLNETRDCRKRFAEYVQYCQDQKLLPEINPQNTRAALVPAIGPLKKIYAPRTLLVGDSASLVSPVSGEGIQYAIRSGHIAGEISAGIIKDNDFRLARFKEYQKRCEQAFGRRLRRLFLLQKIGYRRIPQIIEVASKDQKMQELLFDIMLRGKVNRAFRFGMRYLRHLIFG
jgi:flavin-dependent dehydrogenase